MIKSIRFFGNSRWFIHGILVISLGIFHLKAVAQDPIFSQFYATPLQLNPAFAGTTLAPRITVNHRSQWTQIEGGFKTYAATYEQSIEGMNSGFGLILMADNAMSGVFRRNQFSLIYGYRLQVNDAFFIKFGAEAGLIQNSLDWERLQFGDQIDPVTGFEDPLGTPYLSEEKPPAELSNVLLDISAGLLIYGKNFYGGISLKHLNRPDESFLEINQNLSAGLPMRISAQAGFEISLLRGNNRKYGSFISPNVLYVQQGDLGQINVGAYTGFGLLYGGLWYRHTFSNPDAAIGLVGFKYQSFKIGYSYDFTLSRLGASNPGGTHEISLAINLDDSENTRRRKRAERYIDCFKMWR